MSAGASAPESLVEELLERLDELGYRDHHVEVYAEESVEFALPKELADVEVAPNEG